MIVQSVMTEEVYALPSDSSVARAARRMVEQGIGSVLVVDETSLVGIVTERDLAQLVAEQRDPSGIQLEDVMKGPVPTIEPSAQVSDAVEQMADAGVKRLVVVLDGKVKGLISTTDIAHLEPEMARRIRDRMGALW